MPSAPQTHLNAGADQLQQLAIRVLNWPDQAITITPLPGDASNRRYFRLTTGHVSTSTAILMQLAEPEAFKASEEAVSQSSGPIHELPFLNIWRHLHARGLHVPQVYHFDQETGWLLLEDIGDRLLSQAAEHRSAADIETLYRQAIEELVRLQTGATDPPDTDCLAFTRSFDEALFMWEFDHFITYGIEARRGNPLPQAQRQSLQEAFQPIAHELASQPPCFTHRDYHSRNLMLHRDRLWLIDFQDALLGPPQYDLASLLRDSYLALPEATIDSLIDVYLESGRRAGRKPVDAEAFRRLFDLCSVQRNLKAAGRFVYIATVKNNPRYLSSIPHTLGNVRKNFSRYPELGRLAEQLSVLVPELASSASVDPAPMNPHSGTGAL